MTNDLDPLKNLQKITSENGALKAKIASEELQSYQSSLSDLLRTGPNSIAAISRSEVSATIECLRSDAAEERKSYSLSARDLASAEAEGTKTFLDELVTRMTWIQKHRKNISRYMLFLSAVVILTPVSAILTDWWVYNSLKNDHSVLQQENLSLTSKNAEIRQEQADLLRDISKTGGGGIRRDPKFGYVARVDIDTPLTVESEPGSTFYPIK